MFKPFLRWLCPACVLGMAFAQDPFGPETEDKVTPKEKAVLLRPEKAEEDAAAALKQGDTRFLDVTGYDAIVGVDRWDDGLKDKYGTRLLRMVGGLMFDDEQQAREKLTLDYASRYNRHLVKELKIQFPQEEELGGKSERVQIEKLIDQLALTNEPAVEFLFFPSPSERTPKMDRRVKIHDAYWKLRKHGLAAFSQLADHLDDDRQSVQFESIRRATVGRTCYSILNNQLHWYPY